VIRITERGLLHQRKTDHWRCGRARGVGGRARPL